MDQLSAAGGQEVTSSSAALLRNLPNAPHLREGGVEDLPVPSGISLSLSIQLMDEKIVATVTAE